MDSLRDITESQQLAAVSDPNRVAILRRLLAGQATISMVGASMGRHPAWVRHHVIVLEKAGLVELTETRTTRNFTEKFYRASAPAFAVRMLLRPIVAEREAVVMFASHDMALELLAHEASEGANTAVIPLAVGSLDGLIALRQGLADIAGCHLLDTATGEYNVPYLRHLFCDRDVIALTLAHREQGLMVRREHVRDVKRVDDIAGGRVRFMNRNAGSGTRLWLDHRLGELGIPTTAVNGYDAVSLTHTQAAEAVASGRADVTLGIRAAAEAAGLEFSPLFHERYDLVFLADRIDDPSFGPLLDRLVGAKFRNEATDLHGYDMTSTGTQERVSA